MASRICSLYNMLDLGGVLTGVMQLSFMAGIKAMMVLVRYGLVATPSLTSRPVTSRNILGRRV